MLQKLICATLVIAATLSARKGVTPPNAAEVRTSDERVPAGGTVQVKFSFTQPRPISTSGPSMSTYDFVVNGVGAFSPLGDTAGAAVAFNGVLTISVVSPQGDYGTDPDYPFLTVAMTVPPNTPTGKTFPLEFLDANFQMPTGPLNLVEPKWGTLTIGGSVSIQGVFPGGSTWPAGTVIEVHGTGFQPTTSITAKMKITAVEYVNSSKMRFHLQRSENLDNQPITATNPDGSTVTYYSYLRGTPLYEPAGLLLKHTDPIFQTQTHSTATVGPLPKLPAGQFIALALQNPTPGPVVVTLLHEPTGKTSTITLPSCTRVMDDLANLLDAPLQPDDVVTVTSTSAVQILGLQGDSVARTVTPFLPRF